MANSLSRARASGTVGHEQHSPTPFYHLAAVLDSLSLTLSGALSSPGRTRLCTVAREGGARSLMQQSGNVASDGALNAKPRFEWSTGTHTHTRHARQGHLYRRQRHLRHAASVGRARVVGGHLAQTPRARAAPARRPPPCTRRARQKAPTPPPPGHAM